MAIDSGPQLPTFEHVAFAIWGLLGFVISNSAGAGIWHKLMQSIYLRGPSYQHLNITLFYIHFTISHQHFHIAMLHPLYNKRPIFKHYYSTSTLQYAVSNQHLNITILQRRYLLYNKLPVVSQRCEVFNNKNKRGISGAHAKSNH